jgi:hypothetical protein
MCHGNTVTFLQAEGQPISPWVVRKALENTAEPIGTAPEDFLTTGFGLLQVDRCLFVSSSSDSFFHPQASIFVVHSTKLCCWAIRAPCLLN